MTDNTKAFTLIETLVAISLLTVAVVAPMTLTAQSLSAAYYARDQITAFHLAQEAIETIRNVRDGNILENALGATVDLLDGIPSVSGQPFTVDTRDGTMEQCPVTCPPLKTDGELYGYEDGSPWAATRFTRTVSAESVGGNPDEVRVSVTVSWRSGAFQARTFTISENLYRWVEDTSASTDDGTGEGDAVTFAIPGQYAFFVPEYASLTIKVWGAGGGGASEASGAAGDGDVGGSSSIAGGGANITAGGGQGGRGGYSGGGQGGSGGTASGGTNTPGNAGANTTSGAGGAGGSAPGAGGAGGTGGNNASGGTGSAPGGGGGGGDEGSGTIHGGGGGSGGYVTRTYTAGSLTTGAQLTVIVGQGGPGGTGGGSGGAGGAGRVEITWQ